LSAGSFHGFAFGLVEGFHGIITSFDVDVGLCEFKKTGGFGFEEYGGGIDGLKGCNDEGAICFRVNGTLGTFELAHSLISIDSDEENVPEIAGGFEVNDMAGVEQIETAVGHHQLLAGGAESFAPAAQSREGNDFFLHIHRRMVWRSGGLMGRLVFSVGPLKLTL
jgi:hypothetical protein